MAQSRSKRFFNTQEVDRTPGVAQGGAQTNSGAAAQRPDNPNSVAPEIEGSAAGAGLKSTLGRAVTGGAARGSDAISAGAGSGEASANANAAQPSVTGGSSNRPRAFLNIGNIASLVASYGTGGSGGGAAAPSGGGGTVGAKAGSTVAAKAPTAVSMAPTVVPKTIPNVKMTITPSDAASVKPISAPPISNKYGIQNFKNSPDGFGPQNPSSSPSFSRTGEVGSPSSYVPAKVVPSTAAKVANFGKGLGKSIYTQAKNSVLDTVGIDSGVTDAFNAGNYGEAAGRFLGNNIKNEHQVPAGSAPSLPQEGQRQRFLGTEGQSSRRYRPGGRFTR